jgi:predicted amidohydrolase
MRLARSLAVAQTCPIPGDVEANVREHLLLVYAAASEGAQVVLFPELSLTGYEMDMVADLAFTEVDFRLAPLIAAASSRALTLIVGAPVRADGSLHIGALIIQPDATVLTYTKHHLGAFGTSASCDGSVPPAEATVFHAGDRNPLIRVGGGSAAVAICADTGQSSHPQLAADRGAKTYLASMFVIPSEFDRDAAKLSAYAAQHAMTVAMANYGCRSGGLAAGGRSSIWSETGELLAQLETKGAGIAVATEGRGRWQARTVMVSRDSRARV